jgi:hypothetical protein
MKQPWHLDEPEERITLNYVVALRTHETNPWQHAGFPDKDIALAHARMVRDAGWEVHLTEEKLIETYTVTDLSVG